MRYLFKNLEYLKTFKKDPSTAIVTDIDGTISEIAPTPDEAIVTTFMKEELVKLKEKFKMLAVISGRSAQNAKQMVGVEGLLYVGNHGMEYLKDGNLNMNPEVTKYLSEIKRAGKKLEKGDLSSVNGLIFEDKGICYSIHYRQTKPSENARKKILNKIYDDPDCQQLEVSEGRQLIELKPPITCDKGSILQNIIEEYELGKIIYLGDDITDLDAFRKLKEMETQGKIKAVSILVLSNEIPDYVKRNSSYYINGVNDVIKFFQWLLN